MLEVFAFVALLVALTAPAAWCRAREHRVPLPLFEMLRRRGWTREDAERRLGMQSVAEAAHRCATCFVRRACSAELRRGQTPARYCPNLELLGER